MKSQSAEKSAQSPAAVHKQEVAAAFAEALAASKLRLKDQLLKIVTSKPEVVVEQDAEGWFQTFLTFRLTLRWLCPPRSAEFCCKYKRRSN